MTEAAEAAPEVALPPFSGDHAVCAKCGNVGASITYQQAVTFRQVDVFNGRRRHGPQPERLERECDRCDYQWDEALPTTPPSTDLPPGVLVVDRWIESMQILTGTADNPTPEQHEEMAAMRRGMLDTVRADVLRDFLWRLEQSSGHDVAAKLIEDEPDLAELLHATEATDG